MFEKNSYFQRKKEIIKEMLKKNNPDFDCNNNIDAKNKNGDTALMFFSGDANDYSKEIIRILVANGANINAKNKNEETALIIASEVQQHSTEVVVLLLKNGANINLEDNKGNTALRWAMLEGHKEIVSLLEEKINENNNNKYHGIHENGECIIQ